MNRLYRAFFYSMQGLKTAWVDELAFKQEAIVTCFLIPIAFILAPNRIALILMLGSWALVLLTELLNSALEAAVDRIGPEQHPLSKKAKDMGSAAVLVALLISGGTWIGLLF